MLLCIIYTIDLHVYLFYVHNLLMWFAHFFGLFPQLVDAIYIIISIICSTRWCDLHACLFSGLMWFTCLFVVLVLLVDVICMIICNICSTCWCDLHDCLYDFHYLLMWFTWLLVLLFDVIYMLICNSCSTFDVIYMIIYMIVITCWCGPVYMVICIMQTKSSTNYASSDQGIVLFQQAIPL